MDVANDLKTFTATTPRIVDDAQRAARENDLEVAAQMFEKLFSSMLVREMQRSLPDGFFGGGTGTDVFQGWFEEHLGDVLAKNRALDLAGVIKAQLGGSSEGAPTPAARNEGGVDDGSH